MTSQDEAEQEVEKILFVDDEENILRSLRRLFLEEEEFEIFTASSGEAGLKVLKEHDDIAVIVSDQRMPGMTGVDFLEKSRKISPLSIRVLLTGYADINAAVDAINRGGTFRYITKPWQDEDLVQAVRGALQNYLLIKENRRLNAIVKKQNKELKKWNTELEVIVQEQTMELQRNYDGLKQLNTRLRANFKSTIFAFSALLEMRDKRMRSHSRNVAEVASKVAGVLKMSVQDKETLVVAAFLHDIGKIGIPDLMLQLDYEVMSGDEQEEYRKHPVRGQAAVDAIEGLRKAGVIIRHHHERYDGEGYPDRLKRKEIPLAARILAIIDFIDKRLRKFTGDSGLGVVFKYVQEESGKKFDPRLVPTVEKVAKAFYKDRLPKADFIEMELAPQNLAEGMVVSRDVFSGTGVLLLSKGTPLDRANIQILQRYYKLDPSKRGVFVSMKE